MTDSQLLNNIEISSQIFTPQEENVIVSSSSSSNCLPLASSFSTNSSGPINSNNNNLSKFKSNNFFGKNSLYLYLLSYISKFPVKLKNYKNNIIKYINKIIYKSILIIKIILRSEILSDVLLFFLYNFFIIFFLLTINETVTVFNFILVSNKTTKLSSLFNSNSFHSISSLKSHIITTFSSPSNSFSSSLLKTYQNYLISSTNNSTTSQSFLSLSIILQYKREDIIIILNYFLLNFQLFLFSRLMNILVKLSFYNIDFSSPISYISSASNISSNSRNNFISSTTLSTSTSSLNSNPESTNQSFLNRNNSFLVSNNSITKKLEQFYSTLSFFLFFNVLLYLYLLIYYFLFYKSFLISIKVNPLILNIFLFYRPIFREIFSIYLSFFSIFICLFKSMNTIQNSPLSNNPYFSFSFLIGLIYKFIDYFFPYNFYLEKISYCSELIISFLFASLHFFIYNYLSFELNQLHFILFTFDLINFLYNFFVLYIYVYNKINIKKQFIKITSEELEKLHLNNEICSICLNEYDSDTIRLNSCSHYLHLECLNHIIDYNRSSFRQSKCPICREDILKFNSKPFYSFRLNQENPNRITSQINSSNNNSNIHTNITSNSTINLANNSENSSYSSNNPSNNLDSPIQISCNPVNIPLNILNNNLNDFKEGELNIIDQSNNIILTPNKKKPKSLNFNKSCMNLSTSSYIQSSIMIGKRKKNIINNNNINEINLNKFNQLTNLTTFLNSPQDINNFCHSCTINYYSINNNRKRKYESYFDSELDKIKKKRE